MGLLLGGNLLAQGRKTLESCRSYALVDGVEERLPELKKTVEDGIKPTTVGLAGDTGVGKTLLDNLTTYALLPPAPEYDSGRHQDEMKAKKRRFRCGGGPLRRASSGNATPAKLHQSRQLR